MNIEIRFKLGDRVICQIFPGKFEWCTIYAIIIGLDPTFGKCYQMDNGILVKEMHCFQSRDEAMEWAQNNPPHES